MKKSEPSQAMTTEPRRGRTKKVYWGVTWYGSFYSVHSDKVKAAIESEEINDANINISKVVPVHVTPIKRKKS